MTDLLTSMLQKLGEPVARHTVLENYYQGKQPLAFLSPEAKAAMGNRLGVMASNIPRLAVTALAERLRVTGFTGDDVWADWLRNDLDQLSGTVHREALLFGDSFVMVWADAQGRPKVTVESPKQVAVQRDPGTREITAAIKRWETAKTTEAVLYLPNSITRWRANTTGATTAGFELIQTIPNPLGVVPVVDFRNGDRVLTDRGESEIDDLMPLVDALNKVLADMMVTSEYVGRPRRWATGIEVTEAPVIDDEGNEVLDDDDQPVMIEVNPIPEGNRAMVAEEVGAKFGQLDAADLAGYEASVKILLGQIMAVSTLPSHYVGIFSDNPASADALRASEASLTARAEARQSTFGRSWEAVARLIVAVRDGVDPSTVVIRVQWADAATRSVAQEADAVVKLFSAGLLPQTFALKRLGYADDEITEIRAARRSEALDGAGVNLTAVSGATTPQNAPQRSPVVPQTNPAPGNAAVA